MASIYIRGQTRWIKFYPPGKKKPRRESLGRIDPARAELIRRKLELELKLRQPELMSISLPENLLGALGEPPEERTAPEPANPSPPSSPSAAASLPRTSVKEVLAEYLAYIRVENSPHHVRNKVGYLRRFFGARLLGVESGEKGGFQGQYLDEVRAADVQKLIDGIAGGKKTKRHYRNAFHALFEFAIKSGYLIPTNFRYPNPMSALPAYHERNKPIVFLTPAQIETALAILEPSTSVQMAAALMIYGGLRRAEALWVRRENISPDLSC